MIKWKNFSFSGYKILTFKNIPNALRKDGLWWWLMDQLVLRIDPNCWDWNLFGRSCHFCSSTIVWGPFQCTIIIIYNDIFTVSQRYFKSVMQEKQFNLNLNCMMLPSGGANVSQKQIYKIKTNENYSAPRFNEI